ncbi:hypothetical protein LEM8419_02051 [Neolewinella maritima]|uniref:DUF4271 domain-containing protein n=1 Tax=Neolewinella maritima TaxID=1383882 RepID=A0ABN8F962_9BACT|nr:DUF4271 domain-containing protein [Neolewinella maritima]CAH1001120.1 hypothetical protein LEM8419_02051 [Neolewinella maritima]
MRHLVLLCWLLVCSVTLAGQTRENPFELTDRLPAEQQSVRVDTGNPFDVYPATVAEATPVAPDVPPPAAAAPLDGPGTERSGVVFIHLLLLLMLASLWVLFRNLLLQCLSATFNDNVMTQLYRRRSGGQVGALWLCYLFFLFSAGFYLFLLADYFRLDLGAGLWGGWLTYTLVIASAVGVKFLVLGVLGRIYPLRKELSQYAFALMVFSILTGLLLMPVNLLVSYAPEPLRPYFLYGGLALLVIIYLLHLLRGLFIANRYVGRRPLHFLLYLCTIEIAPLLLVYRYLSSTLV